MRAIVAELRGAGLTALEVYHSDHRPADVTQYLGLAREFELGVTGGSDFHGDVKPGIRLGTGAGNLNIPLSVLSQLRESRPLVS
jgi:predicted metal-dependent phosphoesterase TrpH